MIVGVIVVGTVIVKAVDNGPAGRVAGVNTIDGPCPGDMVFVSAPGGGFCVDIYEASAGPACPDNSPDGKSNTQENLDASACMPVSEPGKLPWRNLSQNQASLACAKAGKRLPTNKEWMLAALGTPDKAGSWDSEDCNVSSNWADQPGLTGSGDRCVSSAGAYDMIGNVWEWVDGTVYDGRMENIPLPENGFVTGVNGQGLPSDSNPDEGDPSYYYDYLWIKPGDTRAIARGGYWDNHSDAGQYAFYIVAPPSEAGKGIGFRCVK